MVSKCEWLFLGLVVIILTESHFVLLEQLDFHVLEVHQYGVNISLSEKRFIYEMEIFHSNLPSISNACQLYRCSFEEISKTYFIELPYAYFNYTIRLRGRADVLTFKTLAAKPNTSPKTSITGFQIKDSKAILFWKAMEAYERNGPNFKYSIQIDGGAKYFTEGTSFKMDVEKNKIYRCSIRAVNEEGESHQSSLIVVNTFESRDKEVSHVSSYSSNDKDNYVQTLQWSAAPNSRDLTNYTVYWCEKKFFENECKKNFDFTNVSKSSTSYQLQLSNGKNFKMGVSANYKDFSSGIQWSSCLLNFTHNYEAKVNPKRLRSSMAVIDWTSPAVEGCGNLTYFLTLDAMEKKYRKNCRKNETIEIQNSQRLGPKCNRREAIVRNLCSLASYSFKIQAKYNDIITPAKTTFHFQTFGKFSKAFIMKKNIF